jgi:hypothetical protein
LTNDHESSELRVYLTGDGVEVYEDAFMKIAKPDGVFKPTLVLVGTRLGLDKVTPVYWESLKASLQMPQSIGIAGYVNTYLHVGLSSFWQWSTVVITLLYWCSGILFLLSRPSPNSSSTATTN